MKHLRNLMLVLFLISGMALGQLPNAWINEIHYDNTGGDENEGIEVVIEILPTYDLSDFRIDLYNGNGGGSYDNETLNNFKTGETDGNFLYFYKKISGIQNGAPDGIALSYQGNLIQFLSYEGNFTATNGHANGETSDDIGVLETSSTTNTQSLQLIGNGTQYSDFDWEANLPQTWGKPNSNGTTDQTLPITLSSFTAIPDNGSVLIQWTTESEVNNLGFNLYKSATKAGEFEKINQEIIKGAGNSSTKTDYTYTDTEVIPGQTYYYQLEDVAFDGATEKHEIISVLMDEKSTQVADQFELYPAYPNPFNPETCIRYKLPQTADVSIHIFNLKGELVRTLVSETKGQGIYEVLWNGRDSFNRPVSNGIYLTKMTTSTGFMQTEKIMLLK